MRRSERRNAIEGLLVEKAGRRPQRPGHSDRRGGMTTEPQPFQDQREIWWRQGPYGLEYLASDGAWYPGQPHPTPYAQPPSAGTNGLAIASLILGIVWVFGLGAILALIFGIVALRQMDRNPRQGGRGLAIAGVVLGGVGVVGLGFFIALAVAAHNNCVQYGNCS